MTRENALRLSQGEIRIGSYKYYHDATHSDAIRDIHEGTTVGETDDLVVTSMIPSETMIAGLRCFTDSGGLIDLGDFRIVRELPQLYIFSTSLNGTEGHFAGYDTVVKIADIEAFGRLIVDGRSDIFQGYVADHVRYEPAVYDALNHPGIEPNPFIKDTKFSRDEEFRIVFIPAAEVELHVTFSLDSIRRAFRDGLCHIE